ncbi:Protein of unknown function [Quadrisphaera granulorum]|uniref:Uncharacterized protein DUF4012 n=1 Tax=Quadrisphaera granulorum TaxID=317664 RepID=A0A316B0M9_9ACTN|nr:DUF4012 domain-containing protein [Quadrisphaera granulorum]PWJ56057.1 uncharacterized protein DUF4012 [Quadrisphaera granulorum]SZE94691.1 Protein of unknown function [Quadrisphaera granulorum]
MSSTGTARRRAKPARPPWRRPALVALGVAALLVVGWAVWGGMEARAAAGHVRAATAEVSAVRAAVASGNLSAASRATEQAALATADARAAVDSPPLALASHLPGKAGEVVAAVRTTVAAVDAAVGAGAMPAVKAGERALSSGGAIRADGTLDPAGIADLAVSLEPAAAAARDAQVRAASVDAAGLPPGLSERVRQAQTGVAELSGGLSRAQALLTALPVVLGGDGPRTYLVAFQNTAELRPTGGIIGTWALLDVNDGRLSLSDAGSNDDLERLSGPVRDLGPEYRALYPAEQVSYSQNVGLSPHFPYAAQLLVDLWTAQGRPAPDGVIAVDPAGLAPLLRGAGTVEVPDGPSVTADTVSDVVLRQAYEVFGDDNAARKNYLTALVGSAFSRGLGGGAWDTSRLVSLGEAVSGGHVQLWTADPAQQEALEKGGAAGALPAPEEDAAGVYLTNISASKLDYYLRESVRVTGACNASPEITIELTNDAPAEIPYYVSTKVEGQAPTTELLTIALYLPPGRTVTSMTVDGQIADIEVLPERGWSVNRLAVAVPRGAPVQIVATTAGLATPITSVHTQPLVHDASVAAQVCS